MFISFSVMCLSEGFFFFYLVQYSECIFHLQSLLFQFQKILSHHHFESCFSVIPSFPLGACILVCVDSSKQILCAPFFFHSCHDFIDVRCIQGKYSLSLSIFPIFSFCPAKSLSHQLTFLQFQEHFLLSEFPIRSCFSLF